MSFSVLERFAKSKPSMIRQIFDAAPPGSLNMGLGMPDLPMPGVAIEAAQRVVDTGSAPYSANAGFPQTREAVAAMYRSWNGRGGKVAEDVQASEVLISSGVQEGLFVVLMALCGEGDEILVPNPGFPAYAMIARSIGASVAHYECGAAQNFRPTANAIEAKITPKTRAVILNAPGNPTGTLARADDLQAICALLDAKGIPYISDEIYDRYTYGTDFVSPSAFSREGIVLSGLSKTANMMGWRLGWVVAPERIMSSLVAVHQAVCTCAPGIAQQVAVSVLEALEGGKGAEDLQRNIGVFADRRARATRLLDAAGLRYAPAEGGFYLFVEVAPLLEKNGRGEDDLAFCLRLLSEEKLIAIPGSGFGPAGKGWVRLAYTCHEVEEGVGRFLRALGLSPSGDTP